MGGSNDIFPLYIHLQHIGYSCPEGLGAVSSPQAPSSLPGGWKASPLLPVLGAGTSARVPASLQQAKAC